LLFWQSYLGVRGTAVAVFDYANAWEEQACGESWLIIPDTADQSAREKYDLKFPGRILTYVNDDDLQKKVSKVNPTAFYAIVGWANSFPPVSAAFLRLGHCVFGCHPDNATAINFAAISTAVPRHVNIPVIPHIVESLESASLNQIHLFRQSLSVPFDSLLLCRHGGYETFSIQFVRDTVCRIAESYPAVHFAFLGTDPLLCKLKNIHYLNATSSVSEKSLFLSSCNACLHARADGETFGLAIAECSILGKPVLTYANPPVEANQHLQFLGNKAKRYVSAEELERLITTFAISREKENEFQYREIYKRFSSSNVMKQFIQNFGLCHLVQKYLL